MTDTESITEKIVKILKKAERAGTPEEADAFFAGAQALMAKYAIDQMTIYAAMKAGDKNPYGELGKTIISCSKSYALQDGVLCMVVAEANDCKVLLDKRAGAIWLYGHEADRVNVELLYTSLLLVVSRQALDYGKKSGLAGMKLYVARRSFRDAFARRIGQRLTEAKKVTVQEAVAGNPLLPAVMATKKDAVEKYMPNAKKTRSRQSYDWQAGAEGRAAANRADLGGPRIGGGPKKAIG